MFIPQDVRILALDGARMSLFRNVGTTSAPNLKLVFKTELRSPATSELGDDRPGRTFQSLGRGRAAYEGADLHKRSEAEFIDDMAQIFCSHMKQPKQQAIVIAPPQVLGQVREHLQPAIRSRLVGEIGKDYAGETALQLLELLNQLEV